jgi:cellulose synthase/poly-beta-1,6-N-acetylglucosamine synthase-like glycosyltransferase
MKITVLIPSHNEEAVIARSIESVLAQTRRPDRIIVVADNCTDRTEEIARECGAEVFETVDNKHRKAGGQNQALAWLLPTLSDEDLIVSMDADTMLSPEFLRNASRHFSIRPGLGACSSNHLVHEASRLVETLQEMEYERDRRYTGRKRGRVGCMTGMASMFSVSALRRIIELHGTVYDEGNWTEDWKLTFALKHAGYRCIRPQDCTAATVPVPRWRELFVQRERWGRGYFQTICEFGLTRQTLQPWLSQAWGALTSMIWLVWMILLAASIARAHEFHFPLWCYATTGIFITERVVTVRKAGWRAALIAGLYLPEILYSWWLVGATYFGVAKHLLGRQGQWGDVRATGKATIT